MQHDRNLVELVIDFGNLCPFPYKFNENWKGRFSKVNRTRRIGRLVLRRKKSRRRYSEGESVDERFATRSKRRNARRGAQTARMRPLTALDGQEQDREGSPRNSSVPITKAERVGGA